MFIDTKMEQTNFLLERALDVETLRRKVIANNIANVNVPHFKRSEVNFESELKRAIREKEESDNKLPAVLTEDKHIPFFVPRDVLGVKPRVHLDYDTTYRNDGSSVDVEKEMVDASKNMLRYNSYVTSLNQNYKILKMVMRTV